MCGIAGYISSPSLVADDSLPNTMSLMTKRGPDSQNYYKSFEFNKEILLLHSRLNIIDLNERSNQPFFFKEFILIFNGEIYNYIELREDLKNKNYTFETDSDTEVLIKCYLEYGPNCVNYFVGMWSFAIWNTKKKELFISRDPFGEKPLYFFICDKGFFFGSEIKFIKSLCNIRFVINNHLIYKNLFMGYKSLNKTNETFYKNIFSVKSGNNLKINLSLDLQEEKYWEPEVKINNQLTQRDIIDETRNLLCKSLNLRMRSDVPVAFCLSGGIDSSLLASIAKKKLNKNISTFSIIDKDTRYNEVENIKLIVDDLKCNSNLVYLENNNELFLQKIKDLTFYHDGPVATLSYYVHSFLSDYISKAGFKVAISGTGADEIFTGYYDHFLLHLCALQKSELFEDNLQKWNRFIKPLLRNPSLKDPMLYVKNPANRDLVYENIYNISQYALRKENIEFEEHYYTDELLRNRMLNEMFHEVVPVILKHDDLNSMYYSIENRSPYLDRDLLKFSLTIPSRFLIADGYQKKVLRDSAQGILLDSIRVSRQKKGFNASISSVVDLDNTHIREFLFDKKSQINEFVDLQKLYSDINFENLPNHMSKLIFSIISTKIFLDQSY